jgi:predicted nucleotidyltransferase
MIPAEELYKKIKEKYLNFKPDKYHDTDFSTPEKPPLTEEQLELLEHGFPVKPNKEVKSRTIPTEHLNKIINSYE